MENLCLALLKKQPLIVNPPAKTQTTVKLHEPVKIETTEKNPLLSACKGKSLSSGGLNGPELRKQLIFQFPSETEQINKIKNRKKLFKDIVKDL